MSYKLLAANSPYVEMLLSGILYDFLSMIFSFKSKLWFNFMVWPCTLPLSKYCCLCPMKAFPDIKNSPFKDKKWVSVAKCKSGHANRDFKNCDRAVKTKQLPFTLLIVE